MAAADTARLVASLEMDTRKFNAGATRALGSINRIDRRLGAFSGAVNRNLGRLVDTAVTRGTQILVDGIKGGIDSLATLEDATTSVDGAIRQLGLTGQVTGAQIATWANEIEAATDAAFDDKDITRNAATLIRYGKVTTSNLRPALVVMTDLAAKTGSVDSAASLLAKALADPTKAAGKLARSGVILTKQQQKQIAAFVKAGKLGKAQKVILDALTKSTKNAAKDSAGPFRDMQNTLKDTVEDAQRLLATGAFPVLQKLGEKFKAALADPQTMKDIENIGKGAADVLDKAIEFGEKVPWGKIRDGLSAAAGFAGNIVNAFASMPPEAQAAIIALAGLNKLSGGAVSSIVGELGKGLIKGVLGMTAGVVNLKAGVVNGGPAVPGAGAAVPGAKPVTGAGRLIDAASKILIVGFAAEAAQEFSPVISQVGRDLHKEFLSFLPEINANDLGWPFGPKNTPTILPELVGGNGLLGGTAKGGAASVTDPAAVTAALNDFRQGERDAWTDTTVAVRDVKREQAMAAASLGTAIGSNEGTTRSGLSNVVGATNSSASRITGAIAANRPIVNNNIDIDITSTGVAKASVTSNRYGPSDPAYSGPSGKYDKP